MATVNSAATIRGLLLALGVFGAVASAHGTDLRLEALGAAYVVVAGAMWFLLRRDFGWLSCAAAIIDIGAVTAFIVLAGRSGFPMWTLYIFPPAAAAAAGFGPAMLAAGLGAAGTWATAGLVPSSSSYGVAWQTATVLAVSLAVTALPSPWRLRAQEKSAWQQLADTLEALRRERVLAEGVASALGTLEADRVHEIIVQAAREGVGANVSLEKSRPGVGGLSPAEGLLAVESQKSLEGPRRAWLERLEQFALAALDRCAAFDSLRSHDRLLQALWDRLPAPAAAWNDQGALMLASAAYTRLKQPAPPAAHTGAPEPREVALGEPAQTFVIAAERAAEQGYLIELYQDVTSERAALRAKDELLSLVGHELRTPLTSIHGFSQMMGKNLAVVQQQVVQIDRLIGDLTHERSGQSDALSLHMQPVDIGELARSAAERFKAGHEAHRLHLDLQQNLTSLRADPARINQVLDNLLSNAAKYSPPDGEIGLSVAELEGQVVLSVQDQGSGLAAEHIPRLFDRFYRVPGAETEHVKGLGLGLSIVRELVEAHGGRVWAESPGPGRGSTFWVSLPVAGPAAPPTRQEPSAV